MKRSVLAVALLSACTLSLSPAMLSAQGSKVESGNQAPGLSTGEGSSYDRLDLTYDRLDLNRDGWISREEAQSEPALSAQYANIDLDGNGYLSPSEFSAFEQQNLEAPKVSSGGGTSYETLDLNKDGWISRNEAQSEPALSAQYADIDRDRNGYLSPSEFSAFEQQEREAPMVPPYGAMMTFEELDTDKDGRLVREEAIHEPKLSQQYSSIDQDRDAYISRSEFSAFEMRERGGKPATRGTEDATPMSFEELDTDNNGVITTAELDAQPQVSGKTAAMDTNRDGRITRQEYEAVMAMQPLSPEPSLASMDVNNDGVVDKQEAKADPTLQEHFDSFDVDRNSQIDKSEFSVFESLYENIREGVTE